MRCVSRKKHGVIGVFIEIKKSECVMFSKQYFSFSCARETHNQSWMLAETLSVKNYIQMEKLAFGSA